jgi:hypothetical protein
VIFCPLLVGRKWALPGFYEKLRVKFGEKVGLCPKKVGFCPVLKKKWAR